MNTEPVPMKQPEGTQCMHTLWDLQSKLLYMEDSGRRMLELSGHCMGCGVKLQFLGVPPGFKFSGPSVSIDGLELSVPVALQGEVRSPLEEMLSKALPSGAVRDDTGSAYPGDTGPTYAADWPTDTGPADTAGEPDPGTDPDDGGALH